jgi:hypothetical protein
LFVMSSLVTEPLQERGWQRHHWAMQPEEAEEYRRQAIYWIFIFILKQIMLEMINLNLNILSERNCISVSLWVCVRVSVYVCMYGCMYVCMYVCMCVCALCGYLAVFKSIFVSLPMVCFSVRMFCLTRHMLLILYNFVFIKTTIWWISHLFIFVCNKRIKSMYVCMYWLYVCM